MFFRDMKEQYNKWDKKRREQYPDAYHSAWESWEDDSPMTSARVAGFEFGECWIVGVDSSEFKAEAETNVN